MEIFFCNYFENMGVSFNAFTIFNQNLSVFYHIIQTAFSVWRQTFSPFSVHIFFSFALRRLDTVQENAGQNCKTRRRKNHTLTQMTAIKATAIGVIKSVTA